ncbi:MAG: hydantoinase/oxoprolinase N-terminal domain-containing protein, partial [Thermomicrobiales bacterium]
MIEPAQIVDTAPLTVAVDIGGTFTDVVVVDRRTGQITEAKASKTPPNISEGVSDA